MTGYSIILNVCVESIELEYIIVGVPGPGYCDWLFNHSECVCGEYKTEVYNCRCTRPRIL